MNFSYTHQEQRSHPRVVLRTGQNSRIKTRPNFKKDVFNNYVTLFNQPIYVHASTLYENPHEGKQRYEILQIQTKQAQKNQQKQAISCDVGFLRRCRNLEYDVQANVKPLLNLQNAGELFKNQIIEQKYSEMEIGKNIIKFSPSTKYRCISCPFLKYTDEIKIQDGIMIRGDFQSGNLASFYQINQNQYAIQLKNDTNTRGYTQWFQFYIKIAQQVPDQQFINFIIFNIRKPIRFMPGMKLLTRSYKQERRNYQQWDRNLEFQFFQNNLGTENKKYYSISFSLQAKLLKEGLFVSLTYPYPFSRLTLLCQQINNLQSALKIIEIGKTTLGNPILLYKVQRDTSTKIKKNIFIIARQHASETSSSFICEFIIKRLTIFNCFHKIFTQFNWHIVPMVNADGVIHGNSRTSIRGYDINRCWALHLLNNSIQAQVINNYIQKINVDSDDIFLDIHSHNREFGMFSYYNFENQFVRFFNTKMNQICKYYDIQKCRAGYDLSKRTTFRVQMSQQHKIKNIITLETSFYGYIDRNNHQLVHFTSHDYEQMAISILKCIQFYSQRECGTNAKKANENSTEKLKIQAQKCHLLYQNKPVESQSESDPDPEGDYLNEQDRKDLQHNSTTIICYPRNTKHNQLQKRTFSQQFNNVNKNIRNNSSDVKAMPEQHVVNLFQATTLNQFPQQSMNIEKKFKTLSLGKNKLSNSIAMSMKQQQGMKMMNKTGANNKSFRQISYSSKQIQNQSYIQRKSFKNLFKSAQIRNQRLQITQRAKKEPKVEENSIQDKIFMKKTPNKQPFRITLSESEKKTTQNIKNIVFPSKIVEKDEYQKNMKVIQQSLRKKNIQINSKCLIIDKKNQLRQKINDKQVSNKKIALLCEYARNINNQTALS